MQTLSHFIGEHTQNLFGLQKSATIQDATHVRKEMLLLLRVPMDTQYALNYMKATANSI
jgi:hypothetical protein